MPLTLNELYTQTKQQYHFSMIAGEAGIDHIMNWVYVSEDSSTHDFLKGGELIITTGINCQDEASLYDFIETMIKSHTCGMILNTGKYILSEDITDSIKALCDKHNYPLIEMPWDVHIIFMRLRGIIITGSLWTHRKILRSRMHFYLLLKKILCIIMMLCGFLKIIILRRKIVMRLL